MDEATRAERKQQRKEERKAEKEAKREARRVERERIRLVPDRTIQFEFFKLLT